ncbi:uncharacterized protein EI90DRAFT_3032302 [Cantharellus anzutake]|uniref:uncharacterized protein n=1 Tax=Cantharellus anzutake TaxID=1750568 RepID=UPI001903FD54|nr:uncharacterized protein EI90DRAFT_3032302 [Cantharellus anzutake]KAF8342159.1 hypothetical protein EI90DRAFT_3032302 [Cantharellus anzutake]
MGQWHQCYVLARVNRHYQCIVGLDHQWLYGKYALEAVVRFMRACQHPFNVHSILSELNHMDFHSDADPYADTRTL